MTDTEKQDKHCRSKGLVLLFFYYKNDIGLNVYLNWYLFK